MSRTAKSTAEQRFLDRQQEAACSGLARVARRSADTAGQLGLPDAVRRHPLLALGAGVGAGLLVGCALAPLVGRIRPVATLRRAMRPFWVVGRSALISAFVAPRRRDG